MVLCLLPTEIHSDLEKVDKPKMFILISTVMTWAKSKSLDPVSSQFVFLYIELFPFLHASLRSPPSVCQMRFCACSLFTADMCRCALMQCVPLFKQLDADFSCFENIEFFKNKL